MTCNPRSTNMTSILRYALIKRGAGKSSVSEKACFCQQKQNAPVPETRADARGKSLVSRVAAGFFKVPAWPKKSEPIEDLVGPEALEPVQRLVQRREFLVR